MTSVLPGTGTETLSSTDHATRHPNRALLHSVNPNAFFIKSRLRYRSDKFENYLRDVPAIDAQHGRAMQRANMSSYGLTQVIPGFTGANPLAPQQKFTPRISILSINTTCMEHRTQRWVVLHKAHTTITNVQYCIIHNNRQVIQFQLSVPYVLFCFPYA